uniref:hypothetical protein n=1 Tax=Streptococcus pneumoniae TaxID=1313 RepID=UPI0018EEF9AC|nr:hypothetical protein [Streptococcus pneumoniae]
MKIKEQTRKLAADCSKHCFEVVDRTDEVSSKHCFEVVDRTDEVSSKHCFEVADRARDFRRVLLYFKGLEIIVFSYLTFEGFTIFKVRKVIGY